MEWIFLIAMEDLSMFFMKCLRTERPVLVEVITERFKGHSISDPGLYRTKEALKQVDAARSDR